MASLIPGYEYDIFIIYRRKENKYKEGEKVKGGVGDQEAIDTIKFY